MPSSKLSVPFKLGLDHSCGRGILYEVILVHGVVEFLLLAVPLRVKLTGEVLLVLVLHGLHCLVVKIIIFVVCVLGFFVVDALRFRFIFCISWILLYRSGSVFVMRLLMDL